MADDLSIVSCYFCGFCDSLNIFKIKLKSLKNRPMSYITATNQGDKMKSNNQSQGQYQSASGSIVQFYEANSQMITVVDGEISYNNLESDSNCLVTTLEAALEMIGWDNNLGK